MYDDDEGITIGKVVVVVLCLLVGGLLLKSCIQAVDESAAAEAAWCQKHNTTPQELDIFARIMNVSSSDVMASPGLQAEFERFERGDLRQTGQEEHREGKHTVTRNTFQ